MGETATGAVERTVDPGGIVDTDILVYVLREVPAAIVFLRDAESYVTVTAITQMELIKGSRNRADFVALSSSYAALQYAVSANSSGASVSP